MSCFGVAATQLAGLAGALLGWRPSEFWAATPSELGAVIDALSPATAAPPDAGLLSQLQDLFPDG
jgi:Phage tail assembly chaperone protein, TAC